MHGDRSKPCHRKHVNDVAIIGSTFSNSINKVNFKAENMNYNVTFKISLQLQPSELVVNNYIDLLQHI